MPKLKEINISFDQIRELVSQLEFDKKISLIKDVVKEKEYRESFYRYTEDMARRHNIPKMSEEELDIFLHE